MTAMIVTLNDDLHNIRGRVAQPNKMPRTEQMDLAGREDTSGKLKGGRPLWVGREHGVESEGITVESSSILIRCIRIR